MAITAISRDWGVNPAIVRITTTDTLSTITTAGYITAQEDEIEALQNGAFTWADTDSILINYSGGMGLFSRDSTNENFIALDAIQYKKVTLTAAQFNGMYAAPVEIIPANGANTIITPKQVMFEVNYGGVQFANGGATQLQYSSTINGAGSPASAATAAAVFIAFVADGVVGAQGSLASATAANTVNKGIYLSNATGAFTAGTSTVTVHVWYAVSTTTF